MNCHWFCHSWWKTIRWLGSTRIWIGNIWGDTSNAWWTAITKNGITKDRERWGIEVQDFLRDGTSMQTQLSNLVTAVTTLRKVEAAHVEIDHETPVVHFMEHQLGESQELQVWGWSFLPVAATHQRWTWLEPHGAQQSAGWSDFFKPVLSRVVFLDANIAHLVRSSFWTT